RAALGGRGREIAGWVLILTGVAAILIPRRGYGWLRRRVVVRRPRGSAGETDGERRALGTGRRFRRPSGPVRTEEELPTPDASRGRTISGTAEPTEEPVEEYCEE